MNMLLLGIIGTVLCFVLIFLRMPIAFAFGIIGFVGVSVLKGLQPTLNILGTIPYGTASNYTWTVIPMYVFLGYLAKHTKLAEEFYEGVRRWVGHFRGGLAATVIIGNAGFGAVSGDSMGAAATFATISLPEMRKYGYSDKLTLGSVAAGVLLAQLIPPSFIFIIYGALTATSIGKLFIAGIIPGLILTVLYLGVIYFLCWRNPKLGPPGPRTTWKEKMSAGTGMWALIIVFLVIIAGLYLGLFTPTEAGGAGACVVLVLGLVRKKLSWQGFKSALIESGLLVAMVGFLLVGTMVFNLFLALTGVQLAIGSFVAGFTESPVGTVLLIAGIFFILGMFIDGLALTLLLVPIFYPVIVSMGVDPVQFGVVFTISSVVGNITPPFGITVFAIAGVAKDVPLFDIFRGASPFIVAIIIILLLVIFIPQISLFLPSTMMGG